MTTRILLIHNRYYVEIDPTNGEFLHAICYGYEKLDPALTYFIKKKSTIEYVKHKIYIYDLIYNKIGAYEGFIFDRRQFSLKTKKVDGTTSEDFTFDMYKLEKSECNTPSTLTEIAAANQIKIDVLPLLS